MTNDVIGPDIALAFAASKAVVPSWQQLLVPTLWRSQVLADLLGHAQR